MLLSSLPHLKAQFSNSNHLQHNNNQVGNNSNTNNALATNYQQRMLYQLQHHQLQQQYMQQQYPYQNEYQQTHYLQQQQQLQYLNNLFNGQAKTDHHHSSIISNSSIGNSLLTPSPGALALQGPSYSFRGQLPLLGHTNQASASMSDTFLPFQTSTYPNDSNETHSTSFHHNSTNVQPSQFLDDSNTKSSLASIFAPPYSDFPLPYSQSHPPSTPYTLLHTPSQNSSYFDNHNNIPSKLPIMPSMNMFSHMTRSPHEGERNSNKSDRSSIFMIDNLLDSESNSEAKSVEFDHRKSIISSASGYTNVPPSTYKSKHLSKVYTSFNISALTEDSGLQDDEKIAENHSIHTVSSLPKSHLTSTPNLKLSLKSPQSELNDSNVDDALSPINVSSHEIGENEDIPFDSGIGGFLHGTKSGEVDGSSPEKPESDEKCKSSVNKEDEQPPCTAKTISSSAKDSVEKPQRLDGETKNDQDMKEYDIASVEITSKSIDNNHIQISSSSEDKIAKNSKPSLDTQPGHHTEFAKPPQEKHTDSSDLCQESNKRFCRYTSYMFYPREYQRKYSSSPDSTSEKKVTIAKEVMTDSHSFKKSETCEETSNKSKGHQESSSSKMHQNCSIIEPSIDTIVTLRPSSRQLFDTPETEKIKHEEESNSVDDRDIKKTPIKNKRFIIPDENDPQQLHKSPTGRGRNKMPKCQQQVEENPESKEIFETSFEHIRNWTPRKKRCLVALQSSQNQNDDDDDDGDNNCKTPLTVDQQKYFMGEDQTGNVKLPTRPTEVTEANNEHGTKDEKRLDDNQCKEEDLKSDAENSDTEVDLNLTQEWSGNSSSTHDNANFSLSNTKKNDDNDCDANYLGSKQNSSLKISSSESPTASLNDVRNDHPKGDRAIPKVIANLDRIIDRIRFAKTDGEVAVAKKELNIYYQTKSVEQNGSSQ